MSRKYYLKEKHQKKLSYFLLCQMKIMIAVSLAVVGMNNLLTNVHAETETYGIYKDDGKVYRCKIDGTNISSQPEQYVNDITYLYIDSQVITIEQIKSNRNKHILVHKIEFLGTPQLKYIGDEAFLNFTHLGGELDFSQTKLDTIGYDAFNNTQLTSIKLPKSIGDIEKNAFVGCSTLESITVDDRCSVYYSENGVLFRKATRNDGKTLYRYPEGKKDESYTVPNGVVVIDENAFANVNHLKNISIPATVTYVKDSAFRKSKVEQVLFEERSQLKTIDVNAFNSSMLNEIVLPEGLENINYGAFSNTQLTTINIPQSVTSIIGNPFAKCSHITAIKVAENNQNYQGADGVLYTNNGEKLISYPTAKNINTFQVKDNVNTIGQWAFSYAKNTPYVVIPNSVNQIETYAFYDSLIKGILFEGTLPTLQYGVFEDIPDLKLYTLNSNDANVNDGLELYKAPALTIEDSHEGKPGDTYQIQPTLNDDATFKNDMNYIYESSNSAIASVTQAGVITMHKAGRVDIKVTAADPFQPSVAIMTVNVKEEVIDEGNQETPPTDPDSGETPNQSEANNNTPNQPESNITPSQPETKPQENQKEPESSNQVKTSDETMIIGMIGMLLLGGMGILTLKKKEN